ncbi:uncharacterized protein [Diabrotica undecimpunctata]|uniref:uncharacterized protein isoform X2 n=1 Tax=Diabrotica undecimpunctata TaxID=50387 RepID=UPI003B63A0AB
MNLFQFAIFLGYFSIGYCYTKYGRSCKDIGCPSSQECVMATDPCSYYHRQGECGSYPTCQRVSSGPRTCATYVCPPTKVCKMDGDTPKCVDDVGKVGHVGYETSGNTNYLSQNGNNGHNGNLYPNLPRGETTPRSNVNRPVSSGGYQGGQVGSGYPGGQVGSGYPGGQVGSGYPGGQVGSGYPGGQVGSGYPGYTPQGSYPRQGYPQQGYPQQGNYPQGYPQGYPQQGYPQSGYPQGYPQQGNYPRQTVYPQQSGYPQQGAYPGYNQGNQRQTGYQQYGGYPQTSKPSSGTSISDKITNGLKSIGGFFNKLRVN